MDLSQLKPIETPETIAREAERHQAIAYLQSTDWYVTRKLEVGTPVPEDIAEKRAEARTKA